MVVIVVAILLATMLMISVLTSLFPLSMGDDETAYATVSVDKKHYTMDEDVRITIRTNTTDVPFSVPSNPNIPTTIGILRIPDEIDPEEVYTSTERIWELQNSPAPKGHVEYGGFTNENPTMTLTWNKTVTAYNPLSDRPEENDRTRFMAPSGFYIAYPTTMNYHEPSCKLTFSLNSSSIFYLDGMNMEVTGAIDDVSSTCRLNISISMNISDSSEAADCRLTSVFLPDLRYEAVYHNESFSIGHDYTQASFVWTFGYETNARGIYYIILSTPFGQYNYKTTLGDAR